MRLPDLEAQDTIAALATPPGTAALAVIRVSGPRAREAACRMAGAALSLPHARARLVRASDMDDFVCTAFHAPRSYTGEDVVEISCHGNPLVVERILGALEAAGVRPAMPGEFTYRAVRNGKMTLEEAERLAHRLHARLPWELDLVEHGAEARAAFVELLNLLREALADLESAIEFGEGAGPDRETVAHAVRRLAAQARLQDRFSRLPRVLLAGAVNTGKSTLFNRIAGYERALVSEYAGTTRDWLETEVRHAGVPFLLMDSAGLRETPEDGPESAGIRNTRELVRDADVIVAFSAESIWQDDPRVISVVPKADVSDPKRPSGSVALPVSGRTGEGVARLLDEVVSRIRKSRGALRPEWWFSARFSELALETEEAFSRIDFSGLLELQAEQLRTIVQSIEEALDVPPADLYGLIFSRFCIGK